MTRQPGQRRSEITKHRVIDAAIEAFGMDGFERTSTRAVVERAGTNLVAIHYHFGGKEAVYRAAAQHIADTVRARSQGMVERGQEVAADRGASRNDLIEGVCALFGDFTTMALAGGVSESWRRFLAREQLEPTATGASEAIFAAIRPYFDTAFTLVARLLRRPPGDSEVRLLTMMIFGQLSVFRNRAAALRLLGWQQIGPDELREFRAFARKYIFTLLDGAPRRRPAPAPSGRRGLGTRPRR